MKYEFFGKYKQTDLNLYICDKDENLKPGVRYGPVIRDLYIIECCTGGYGAAIINGKEFPVKNGDCIILLPGDVIIHVADDKEPRRGVWCGINGMKTASYVKMLGINSDAPYAPSQAFGKITKHINKLIEMKSQNDAGADLRRSAQIHMMFGEMLRYVKKHPDNNEYVQKAINIMETKYQENLNVSVIAKELCIERCYFSTVFKQSTGKTPYSYLNEMRIKKACTLIDMGGLSIKEIATATGIEPVNFSRVFKKYTGKLPLEYKNRIK